MSRKTNVPAIPVIPSQVDPLLKPIIGAMKEALEVQVGQRGDDLDKAVTFRDLTDSGMVTLPAGAVPGGGTIIPKTDSIIAETLAAVSAGAEVDLSPPPTPLNLQVNGTFTNIILSWEGGFLNALVASTEVYRNDTDDLITATHIGSTSAHIYVDTVEPDSTYYYWVRFRSPAAVVGVFNGTDGTLGQTNELVANLIAELNAATGNSALSQTLRSQLNDTIISAGPNQPTAHADGRLLTAGDKWIDIELVDQAGTDPVVQVPKNDTYLYSGSAWVSTENSGIAGAVAAAATAGAIADGKVRVFYQTNPPTEQTDTLDGGDLWIDISEAEVGDGIPQNILNRWDISVIPFAWAEVPDANIAGALQAAGIAKTTADRKVMVYFATDEPEGTVEIPLDTDDLWIDIDDGDAAHRWNGTEWLPLAIATNASVDTKIIEQVGYCEYTNAEGISSVAGAYATKTLCEAAVPASGTSFTWKANGAIASELKTTTTTVGEHTSTISEQTGSINGLRSQKVVKIDNGTGKIVGYGLASGAACLINGLFDESKDQAQCAAAGGIWTDSSEFAINVDHFKISSPEGDVTPFQVVAGTGNGTGMCIYNSLSPSTSVTEAACRADPDFKAWIDEGVYMTNAMIMDASIDVAKIANLTTDFMQVTTLLTAPQISAITLDATQIDSGYIDTDRIDAGLLNVADMNLYGTLMVNASGTETGAIAWGKTHGNDFNNTGMYFGMENGQLKFNMGSQTSYMYFDGTTIQIVNSSDVPAPIGGTSTYTESGTYVRQLVAANIGQTITIKALGGGGGGGTGSTSTPYIYTAPQAGQATTVKIKRIDGTTRHTLTASGGAAANQGQYGHLHGQAGVSASHGGVLVGAGGAGGLASNYSAPSLGHNGTGSGSGGGGAGDWWDNKTGYGGSEGSYATVSFSVESNTDYIEVTIRDGGDGGARQSQDSSWPSGAPFPNYYPGDYKRGGDGASGAAEVTVS